MTKVCMIVHQYYYRDSRVRRYAEALVEAGTEVDVICVRAPHRPHREILKGVRVFTIPLDRGYKKGMVSYLIEYAIALVLYTLWLLRLYIQNHYDLIHVHNMPDFLVWSALLPRIFGAKLILDVHDPTPEFYMSKYQKPADSRVVRIMRIQERGAARLVHAVIAANNNFKANLAARGIPADKITVVHNLPDLKVFDRAKFAAERSRAREHFTLLYPGTIAPRYNLALAIHAIPMLAPHIPNLRLVIIGPKVDHTDELMALANTLGVADYVEFPASVPADQVPGLIAQADIGIYPALPDAHMDIAVPSKVLEYAVMGIPIVASRLTVLKELFAEDAICFFTPGDVAEFMGCVRALYDAPAKRARLVRNADTSFVETHSWAQERQAYFDLVEKLLT